MHIFFQDTKMGRQNVQNLTSKQDTSNTYQYKKHKIRSLYMRMLWCCILMLCVGKLGSEPVPMGPVTPTSMKTNHIKRESISRCIW